MPSRSRNVSNKRSLSLSCDQNTIMVCLLVIVLIGVAVYYIVKANDNQENFESQPMSLKHVTEKPNPGQNEVYLILFYVEWCPHCVSAKPEIAKLTEELDGKKVNNVKVNVRANNCEDSEVEQELARENNVEGYPTIKLVKNNEVVDYNGPRTKEGLMEFLNEETKN
jgi:thiol-disulfide isomerase/thioredoxin|uniref:Thioredoxin n=1 Tax=Mimiviridae sp. ChoanoV1 TaxID=2596887 RepID=A0A5B8IIY1_9VIRU|nr:thioredoxin [Mimiviridae sp. ChoanoV1]